MHEVDQGPLQRVFPCSESKILDHMLVMRDFDYTVPEISEITGVELDTTQKIVDSMERQGLFVRTTRDAGGPIVYQFSKDSAQGKSLRRMAFDVAKQGVSEILETVTK